VTEILCIREVSVHTVNECRGSLSRSEVSVHTVNECEGSLSRSEVSVHTVNEYGEVYLEVRFLSTH